MIGRRATLLGATSLVLASCAYFNGLYNADRLAKDAAKAERDGRTAEARSLWAQAAMKAESVVVKHPDSKYRDDALLLLGRSLRQVDQCPRALSPLSTAAASSPDAALREEARLTLAQCYVELGIPDSAVTLLDDVLARHGALTGSALLWRGRAHMALGLPALAVGDLESAGDPEARFDLAGAYVALDSTARASQVLAQQLDARYDEEGWARALDNLSRASPEVASAFVDSLTTRGGLTAGQQGRLFLADARHLESAGREDRALERWQSAADVARDSLVGAAARAELALRDLRQASEGLDRLAQWEEPIAAAAQRGADLPWPAAEYAGVLRVARLVLERRSGPHADLQLFRVAELTRDSLEAPGLARRLFDEIVTRYPESPIAPKALIAAGFLGGASGDSLRTLLMARYGGSPYVLALEGQTGPAFLALEDSLRTLMGRIGLPSRRP